MKLLIADQFSEIGGAQRVLLDLLPAFRREGWDILLAVPQPGDLTRASGLPFETIPCGPYGCGRKTITDYLRFVKQMTPLRRRLQEIAAGFRPDVLYVNGPRIVPRPPTATQTNTWVEKAMPTAAGLTLFIHGAAKQPAMAEMAAPRVKAVTRPR